MLLIKRNLLLFFRDKAAVFFSLLAVFIIILLYILFLGDVMEESLRGELGFDSDRISVTMSSLTLAGMIAVTSISSSMGALAVSISDKQNVSKDFKTSPVSERKITLGYMLSSSVVGFIMTSAALILCEIYIVSSGGDLPGAYDCFRLLLTLFLSVLCGNAMVFFMTSFIKSQGAYSSASMITGTLIGFLMGVYIPAGSLPSSVQWVIKCFPMSHSASMFRQILAEKELSSMFSSAPPESLENFKETFSVIFKYGDFKFEFWMSAAVLAAVAALFYALSLIIRSNKKD